MADDDVLPYDPSVLERMQKISDAKQLTPAQRAAKAKLIAMLERAETAVGIGPQPPDKERFPMPPLTEEHQKAYDLICTEGPLTGRQIVRRLNLTSESLFTGKYVPELKRHGIKNRRGLGYYHPDFYRPGPVEPVGKR